MFSGVAMVILVSPSQSLPPKNPGQAKGHQPGSVGRNPIDLRLSPSFFPMTLSKASSSSMVLGGVLNPAAFNISAL